MSFCIRRGDSFAGNVSQALPPPTIIWRSNWNDSIVLQYAHNCVEHIFNCATPYHQIWWEEGEDFRPIAIFDARPPVKNYVPVIVLNCADIIFNCADSHLRYEGSGFHSSALITNYGVKLISVNWVVIVLNSAANIFNCTALTPRYRKAGETLAPIAIFDAELPGINCDSIVLYCADTIFNCAGPYSDKQVGVGLSFPPPIGNFNLGTVLFQFCSLVQQSYLIELSSFPWTWHFRQEPQFVPPPSAFLPLEISVSKWLQSITFKFCSMALSFFSTYSPPYLYEMLWVHSPS